MVIIAKTIAYTLSSSPNLKQVKDMLEQAFREEEYDHTILHSNQRCFMATRRYLNL